MEALVDDRPRDLRITLADSLPTRSKQQAVCIAVGVFRPKEEI